MTDEFTPRDFVYAGARTLSDRTLGAAIHFIDSDGKLGSQMLFAAKSCRGRVIGTIYRGASFGGDQVQNLSRAIWAGRLDDDRPELIDWEAKDKAAKVDDRTRRLEKDAKKRSAIEDALLPIRTAFWAARKRGDYEGARAIEQAILMALHKPVKDQSNG